MQSETIAHSTCPYCGVGCGVQAQLEREQVVAVRGDPQHPANFGKLCVKGSALDEVLGARNRLLHPQIGEHRVHWDEALDHVAQGLSRTISEHGPDAVALYLSGQLLTEDYYVANKLMKGFVGTANVDTNSRLCMASAVVGYKRAFGADAVPCCYEDLDAARLLVLVGSNAAWNHPVLFQRMKANKRANPDTRVVVIDPRRTATCDAADLHLALRPGSDALLFNGLLAWLEQSDALDPEWLAAHCDGAGDALLAARESAGNPEQVAKDCDVDINDLLTFYHWFTDTRASVTFYSQGVNQSSSGTDKSNAIINCHLATGRIGRPGMGPFSITGQPNAMGGREVGGLANQLAAHMDFNAADIDRVQRFWQAPRMAARPGLKAVELFQAVEAGKVKAVWIMGTNPVVSLPNADQVKRALQACPLVIVSDCMAQTDTLNLAHVRLPALGWSEKDGTVTNSERRISRQRALLPASGEARADWDILCDVAGRMGFADAFAFSSPAAIFREHAALSAFENDGQRDFDLSALMHLSDEAYQQLKPIQWPVNAQHPEGCKRLFSDGRFFHPNGRARLIPIQPREPEQQPDADYPLIMNTGRIRDQWHTMAVTGRAARLFQHRDEPFVSLHPEDAAAAGVCDQGLVEVHSARGRYVGRARIEADSQRKGEIFVPMHWTEQFSGQARMGALIAPVTDPLSGQPESKQVAVRITPLQPAWEGFLVTRSGVLDPTRLGLDYWARIPATDRGSEQAIDCLVLADRQPVADWAEWCEQHLQRPSIWLADPAEGRFRAASLIDRQLQWALFILPRAEHTGLAWLASLFRQEGISLEERRALLSMVNPEANDSGPILCSCFQVGEKTIEDAIARGCTSVEALAAELRCGSNCGSCIPELNAMIARR